MKNNLAILDRMLRLLMASFVILFYCLKEPMSKANTWVLGLLALYLIVTGFVGFCPLYRMFHISTLKEKYKK